MSKGTKALATIIGRMGSEVTVRTTQAGKKIGSLRLACTSGWGDNELTSWFDVVVFDEKKVEVLERFTKKGSRVMAQGELRVRKWEKEGVERFTTECVVAFEGSIELLDSKDEAGGGGGQRSGSTTTSKPASTETKSLHGFGSTAAFGSDLDDDVPF